jgi:signal transduction histidine kinase
MTGGTDLLLDPAQSANLTVEQREIVSIVKTSGEAMLTIINDILDLSKIEAGRLELEPSSFSIRQCVENAVDVIACKAHSRELEIVVIARPAVPCFISQDYKRLTQILFNLLSNAVKFSEQGDVVVTISVVSSETVANSAEQTRYVLQFDVKDCGIGVPETAQHRLFKTFSQVHADAAVSSQTHHRTHCMDSSEGCETHPALCVCTAVACRGRSAAPASGS